MKLAATLASLALAAALLGGCGDSGDGGSDSESAPATGGPSAPPGARSAVCRQRVGRAVDVRATGMRCQRAAQVIGLWARDDCLPARGASRAGCGIKPFRCLAVASGRGYSVSCASAGRSIAFTVPRE